MTLREHDIAAYLRAHPQCWQCAQPAETIDLVLPGEPALARNRANWRASCETRRARRTKRWRAAT
jgi:hypothetical protein